MEDNHEHCRCLAKTMVRSMPSTRLQRANVTAERHTIEVRGIPVEVVRKDIKNLHLGVYPPKGRVRVAAPFRAREGINGGFWRGEDKAAKEGEADILLIRRCSLTHAAVAAARPKSPVIDSRALNLDNEALRLAVISRLRWIRRQQEGFQRQDRHHNEQFRDLMDNLMPQRRLHREELNPAPLAMKIGRTEPVSCIRGRLVSRRRASRLNAMGSVLPPPACPDNLKRPKYLRDRSASFSDFRKTTSRNVLP